MKTRRFDRIINKFHQKFLLDGGEIGELWIRIGEDDSTLREKFITERRELPESYSTDIFWALYRTYLVQWMSDNEDRVRFKLL